MKRREFIGLVGGAVVAWPVAAQGQQVGQKRRVGVLMGYAENNRGAQIRFDALKQGLAALGWIEDHNIIIDVRWSAGSTERATVFAKELAALSPDVIVANTTPATAALYHETGTIPIVFVVVTDPIGSGFVQSLAHPGGNITGFIQDEGSLAGKWFGILKEIAPKIRRVAVMYNPQTAPYADVYLRPLDVAASSVGMTADRVAVSSDTDIKSAIAALGREPGGGLVLMTDSFLSVHRQVVIEQTAYQKVPCVYFLNEATAEGGLISYAADIADLFRRTGQYVDRVLRGAMPADLPVQLPTKYELVVNLKTAKALGLDVPPSLLARADEVIE